MREKQTRRDHDHDHDHDHRHGRQDDEAMEDERPRRASVGAGYLSPISWLDGIGLPAAPAATSARASDEQSSVQVAQRGVQGPGQPLPHLDQIQASFGASHDVSQVRAHVGGEAAEASSAIGAQAYAVGSQVAFAQTPDLHLAAHEATHVIQQRGGVSLKGDVGQAGDAHEQHADAVADLVVAGKSAARLLDAHTGSSGGTAPVVQRFGTPEHEEVGNLGSKNARYQRAGMFLRHGDLVALRGDFLEEQELLERWNRPSSNPGKEVGSQDELIAALLQGNKHDDRFAAGGPWHELEISSAVKDAVDKRYQNLAVKNTNHFVQNSTGAHDHDHPEGGSAPATYREAHERAIRQAFLAGQRRENIDTAMITEGMGQHFLTDAFAAGHISTPRGGVLDYWNGKYPNFGAQFLAKLIRDVSAALDEQASGLSDAIPRALIEKTVKDKVEGVLAGSPTPSFGDIVSLVAHDADNAAGMPVTNDLDMKWDAVGDSQLNKNSGKSIFHKSQVVSAVEKGCDDIRAAYQLGASGFVVGGGFVGYEALYTAVRAQASAPTKRGHKYAAEQLMPRLDESRGAERVESWRVDSIAQLWNALIHQGGTETYGDRIAASAKGGDIRDTLVSIHKKLEEKVNPFSLGKGKALDMLVGAQVLGLPGAVLGGFDRAHGFLYPQRAFEHAVLKELSDPARARRFLMDIVGE